MNKINNIGEGPIYIGGLAHSGKTPLRLMLGAHPDIAMTRRTYMWNRFYARYGSLSQGSNFERCLAAMLKHEGIRALNPDPERIRRDFHQGPKTYPHLFALFHQHHAQRQGKRRWGDQLGFVERFAPKIMNAFPAARMIHMIRDPRDTFAQAMSRSRYRPGKVGWSTARWIHSAELAQRNLAQYPRRYKVVRYETLIARPERTLQDICAFLQENYMPSMLQAAAANREEPANGRGMLAPAKPARQKGNRTSQKQLPGRALAFTQGHTQRHMQRLGYELKPPQLSLLDRLLFYLVDWPTNRAGMAAWRSLSAAARVGH